MEDTQIVREEDADWYDRAWTRRASIKVNHKMVAGTEDLIDFPMFFDSQAFNLSAAQPTGNDFLFTAGDGLTKLSHEIRGWDPAKCQLTAYVKIPRLSHRTDTLLFLYYGNPEAPNQEDREGVWKSYSYVGKFAEAADYALKVLEALFDDPGLRRLRQRQPLHPAVLRYDAMSATRQGCVRWPDDKDRITLAGVAALDALDMRHADTKSAWDLVAEPEALRQIKTRLSVPEKFLDQFAVIRCWSMLSGLGIQARLVERDGFPDIRIDLGSDESWIEVKRIRLGTSFERVRRVLSKANRQLKKASPEAAGLVYLEVSQPIQVTGLSDAVPADVSQCVAETKREFGSGRSRSIGRVIVAWDDLAILGQPPEFTMFVFRGRSVVLDHPSARSVPPLTFGPPAGRTIQFFLRWDKNE